MARSFTQFLGVINDPDLAGTSCNYNDFGVDLDPLFNGVTGSLSLPGFIASYFHPDFPNVQCNIPVANLQSSDTTLCEKNCINFFDLTGSFVSSWQWLFPGATPPSDTLQNPVNICYNTYGSFDVTLIVSNGAGTDTLFLPGFINVLPSPATPTVNVIGGDTLISSAAFSYQWVFNTVPISGANTQLYIATQPGTYYVIVSDSNGCKATSQPVLVTTGIDEYASAACMQVKNTRYNDRLTITLESCKQGKITVGIYDLLGRQIYKTEERNTVNGFFTETIPFSFARGLYMYVISSGTKMMAGKINVN